MARSAAEAERNPTTSRYLARAIRFTPDNVAMEIPSVHVACPGMTLGILAGGRATRLGGIDKAWLHRDGIHQVIRLCDILAPQFSTTLVSANRNLSRYVDHNLQTVTDRTSDAGPISGIDALVGACRTRWLLTIPVDVLSVPVDLLERLATTGQGAFAADDDGQQPLVALWPVAETKDAVASALASNTYAVYALQARLHMPEIRFQAFRFGNLNTSNDLDAAGMTQDSGLNR